MILFIIWKYVVSDWVYALHEWFITRYHRQSDFKAEDARQQRKAFRGKWRETEAQQAGAEGSHSDRTQRRASTRPPLTPRATYLRVLGLKPGANQAEIKTAYRKKAKVYHPDRFLSARYSDTQRATAARKMRLVNEAYDWLEAHPL
ncbi:MAG: J domain-containing protein [Pseudomonadota bacterium]